MSKQVDNFHLLTSKQRKFILNDDSVLADLVKTNMSEERFNHSLGTADLAKELASYHHIDENKAYKAGLLHDLAKEIGEEEMDNYLRYYDPELLEAPSKVKHSFVGKYYLKDKLHIHDSDILNAVYNHTVLLSKDKLSMIIYIADKREVNRNIDDDVVEVAKYDLKKAVALLIDRFPERKEWILKIK